VRGVESFVWSWQCHGVAFLALLVILTRLLNIHDRLGTAVT
jgi:hypothetical protein